MGILADEREALYYRYLRKIYSVSKVVKLEFANGQMMATFNGDGKFPLSQLLFILNIKPQEILDKMRKGNRKVVVPRRFASLFRFFGCRDTKRVTEKLPEFIICISELKDFPKSHRDVRVLADVFKKRVELRTSYKDGSFSVISAMPEF